MKFAHFECFYDYYLNQHRNRTSRILHFVGTTCAIALLIMSIVTRNWNLLWFVPVAGYCVAWIGHWVFEGNNPASFKNPILSLRADMKMYWEMLTGKVTF